MPAPRILITLDTGISHRRGVPLNDFRLHEAYVSAVTSAGGIPLLAAPSTNLDIAAALIEIADGLVVTGGAFDIEPEMYGAPAGEGRLDAPKPVRTTFETALIRRALARHQPILAVCGGMQLLNVVLGGTLLQDIATEVPDALEHEQPTSPETPFHPVALVDGGLIRQLCGRPRIEVNTTHHQAVERLGDGVEALGHAPDGVIEAVGVRGHPEIVGIQWHPELLADPVSDALYGHLVECAGRARLGERVLFPRTR